MNLSESICILVVVGITACNPARKESASTEQKAYSSVKIVGAMKDVMWKGELGGSINLDTIADKNGLYGLGPLSYLKGELLINNGKSYSSKVVSDSSMIVEEKFDVSAPFFVYANVKDWKEIDLPARIENIGDLEEYIDEKTKAFERPFTFKLVGEVESAIIHTQNLPEGTEVSSPDEAHQGQINYTLKNENTEIVGFFSTDHKGVFTHHDTFLHMHLITKDEQKMGHLDEMVIKKMKLYLPKK